MSLPILDNLMQTEIDQIYHLFDLCDSRQIVLRFSRQEFQESLLSTSDRPLTVQHYHERLHYALYSVPNRAIPVDPKISCIGNVSPFSLGKVSVFRTSR